MKDLESQFVASPGDNHNAGLVTKTENSQSEKYAHLIGGESRHVTLPKAIAVEIQGILQRQAGKITSTEEVRDAADAKSRLKQIADSDFNDNGGALDSLCRWAQADRTNIDLIEESVAEYVQENGVNLSLLSFLGDLEQVRPSLMVNDKLAEALELMGDLRPAVQDQLTALNRTNNPGTNLALHKIMDFVHTYGTTVQDHTERELDEKSMSGSRYGFFFNFIIFLREEISHSKNYLVRKHGEDIVEMLEQFDRDNKKGVLHGTPGGAADETIYTFRRIKEANDMRLRSGIHEGFPVANPALPIARGYIGFYRSGKLVKVFKDTYSKEKVKNFQALEKEFISQNNSDDNYIYDVVNEPVILDGRHSHPSNKLSRLRDIWDFNKHLRDMGREFYYDLSRINGKEMHPMVYADFLTRNEEYLHRHGFEKNDGEPLSLEQFFGLHYTNNATTKEEIYAYQNLTRLHMRKKIEDDFGVDIADYDLRTQRNFLEFLETRDVENVAKLRDFVAIYRNDGLRTFLSLDLDQSLGDKIVALGEMLPEKDARTIFSKYAEIVDATENLVSYVEETFGEDKKKAASPALVGEIREKMLWRGKDLLARFAERVERGEEFDSVALQKELEQIKASNALFLSALKSLHEAGVYTNLDEIKSISQDTRPGPEVSEKDRQDMREMYTRNYSGADQEELQKFLLKKLEEYFSDATTTFEIVRHDGEIRAFYRMTYVNPEKVYLGAFNVDPEFHGATLGETVLDQSVARWGQESGLVIEADAPAYAPINRKYIESGFIGTATEDFHGAKAMKIYWNNVLNPELFRSKTMLTKEIIDAGRPGEERVIDDGRVSIWVGEKAAISEHIESIFSRTSGTDRFVLTRSFEITDETGRVLAVIVCEKVRGDHLNNYETSTFSERYDYPYGARKEGGMIVGPNDGYFIV